MNLRVPFAFALALQIAAPFVAADTTAAQAPSAAPAAAPAGGEEKDTELEGKMHAVGKAYRKLKKQVADPSQNASSLQLLATMQDGIKASFDLTPAKEADIPDAQKAQFNADYKAGLKDMQDLLAKLGDALSANKNDEAAKIVADIDALQKKSHKSFRKPKDN